ncbi:unnamed protein product [Linum tenue]|uniref:Uncharacterized protein n=1 Tax=Linum tenue TaxID=586396 RepID=A0AAV0QZ89_9ROSI|nr:unnamed protein product [Linum tenue]
MPRRLLPHNPLPHQPIPPLENPHPLPNHLRRRRPPAPPRPLRRLHPPLVPLPPHPRRPLLPLPPPLPPPLSHGEVRVPPPRRRQLPLRPLDLLAPPPPLLPLHHPRNDAVSSPLVHLRGARGGPRRQDLRPVVHQGEAVPLHRRQPDQPDVRHREPRRGAGRRRDGVEGGGRLLVLARDGSLPGVVCDAVPAALRRELPAVDAPAGVLLVLCCS